MNSKSDRIADMAERVIGFLVANIPAPGSTRLAAAHTELVAIKDGILAAAESQVFGSGHSEGGVDGRAAVSRELRDYLKYVNRTGRTIAEENPELGLGPVFRLPKGGSYPALIATTNAVIAAATPSQPLFVEAGLPETFLADLQGLLTTFQNATRNKTNGGITRVGGTSAIDAKAREAVRVARKLDTYVRNHFRGNTEKLAAWTHARRIERNPVRKTAPVNPTTAPAPQP